MNEIFFLYKRAEVRLCCHFCSYWADQSDHSLWLQNSNFAQLLLLLIINNKIQVKVLSCTFSCQLLFSFWTCTVDLHYIIHHILFIPTELYVLCVTWVGDVPAHAAHCGYKLQYPGVSTSTPATMLDTEFLKINDRM